MTDTTFTIQLHLVNGGACARCRRIIEVEPVILGRQVDDVGLALLIVELYHPRCAPAPKVHS